MISIKDELNTKPKSVLVHNPILSGVLNYVDKTNHLDLLFPLPPDAKKAAAEHQILTKLLEDQGIAVVEAYELFSQAEKTALAKDPNLIFTRDPIITLPWSPKTAILSRMRSPVRAAEPAAFEAIAGRLGLERMLWPPKDVFLEGGDVIPVTLNNKRIVVVRTGGRSSPSVVEFLLNKSFDLCDSVLEIHCDHKTLHLDSVMGICGGYVVCDRKSIQKGSLHDGEASQPISVEECLRLAGLEIIPVSFAEADRLQATNFINIGPSKIIAYSGCGRIIEQLEARNIEVLSFDGDELAKGRGGPRCLTRPLY